MKGSCNLFADVKTIKNVGGPICHIIVNNVFCKLSK